MRTIEPTTIVKGERIEWTKSFDDYSAALYTLEYRFRGPGTGIDVNATADGRDFNCVIAKTVSDDFTVVGKYRWQAWLTEIADSGNTFVVGEGIVTVKAGFDTASQVAVELRSTAKQIVDALEAALIGTASREQMEYEISTPAGSRRVRYMSRKEQTELLEYYKKIVARENAAERVRNGGRFGTQVKVRMRES